MATNAGVPGQGVTILNGGAQVSTGNPLPVTGTFTPAPGSAFIAEAVDQASGATVPLAAVNAGLAFGEPLLVSTPTLNSTLSIAAGGTSTLVLPAGYKTLSIVQTSATPQAYKVSLYNGANLVGVMSLVGLNGDAVQTSLDYAMRSINLDDLGSVSANTLVISAYATNTINVALSLTYSSTPILPIRNITYNAYDILGHAATTADTLGGTFTNFSFSCKGARAINWKTILTSTAAATSALNWTSVSPALWIPLAAVLTFTGAGSSALFASFTDTQGAQGAYLLHGTGVTNAAATWSISFALLPANIFGFQVVAGTGTPPQILDMNIVLTYY